MIMAMTTNQQGQNDDKCPLHGDDPCWCDPADARLDVDNALNSAHDFLEVKRHRKIQSIFYHLQSIDACPFASMRLLDAALRLDSRFVFVEDGGFVTHLKWTLA